MWVSFLSCLIAFWVITVHGQVQTVTQDTTVILRTVASATCFSCSTSYEPITSETTFIQTVTSPTCFSCSTSYEPITSKTSTTQTVSSPACFSCSTSYEPVTSETTFIQTVSSPTCFSCSTSYQPVTSKTSTTQTVSSPACFSCSTSYEPVTSEISSTQTVSSPACFSCSTSYEPVTSEISSTQTVSSPVCFSCSTSYEPVTSEATLIETVTSPTCFSCSTSYEPVTSETSSTQTVSSPACFSCSTSYEPVTSEISNTQTVSSPVCFSCSTSYEPVTTDTSIIQTVYLPACLHCTTSYHAVSSLDSLESNTSSSICFSCSENHHYTNSTWSTGTLLSSVDHSFATTVDAVGTIITTDISVSTYSNSTSSYGISNSTSVITGSSLSSICQYCSTEYCLPASSMLSSALSTSATSYSSMETSDPVRGTVLTSSYGLNNFSTPIVLPSSSSSTSNTSDNTTTLIAISDSMTGLISHSANCASLSSSSVLPVSSMSSWNSSSHIERTEVSISSVQTSDWNDGIVKSQTTDTANYPSSLVSSTSVTAYSTVSSYFPNSETIIETISMKASLLVCNTSSVLVSASISLSRTTKHALTTSSSSITLSDFSSVLSVLSSSTSLTNPATHNGSSATVPLLRYSSVNETGSILWNTHAHIPSSTISQRSVSLPDITTYAAVGTTITISRPLSDIQSKNSSTANMDPTESSICVSCYTSPMNSSTTDSLHLTSIISSCSDPVMTEETSSFLNITNTSSSAGSYISSLVLVSSVGSILSANVSRDSLMPSVYRSSCAEDHAEPSSLSTTDLPSTRPSTQSAKIYTPVSETPDLSYDILSVSSLLTSDLSSDSGIVNNFTGTVLSPSAAIYTTTYASGRTISVVSTMASASSDTNRFTITRTTPISSLVSGYETSTLNDNDVLLTSSSDHISVDHSNTTTENGATESVSCTSGTSILAGPGTWRSISRASSTCLSCSTNTSYEPSVPISSLSELESPSDMTLLSQVSLSAEEYPISEASPSSLLLSTSCSKTASTYPSLTCDGTVGTIPHFMNSTSGTVTLSASEHTVDSSQATYFPISRCSSVISTEFSAGMDSSIPAVIQFTSVITEDDCVTVTTTTSAMADSSVNVVETDSVDIPAVGSIITVITTSNNVFTSTMLTHVDEYPTSSSNGPFTTDTLGIVSSSATSVICTGTSTSSREFSTLTQSVSESVDIHANASLSTMSLSTVIHSDTNYESDDTFSILLVSPPPQNTRSASTTSLNTFSRDTHDLSESLKVLTTSTAGFDSFNDYSATVYDGGSNYMNSHGFAIFAIGLLMI